MGTCVRQGQKSSTTRTGPEKNHLKQHQHSEQDENESDLTTNVSSSPPSSRANRKPVCYSRHRLSADCTVTRAQTTRKERFLSPWQKSYIRFRLLAQLRWPGVFGEDETRRRLSVDAIRQAKGPFLPCHLRVWVVKPFNTEKKKGKRETGGEKEKEKKKRTNERTSIISAKRASIS